MNSYVIDWVKKEQPRYPSNSIFLFTCRPAGAALYRYQRVYFLEFSSENKIALNNLANPTGDWRLA